MRGGLVELGNVQMGGRMKAGIGIRLFHVKPCDAWRTEIRRKTHTSASPSRGSSAHWSPSR